MDVCLIRLWTFYTFKYVICNRSLILHFFCKTIAQTSISFASLFCATYIFFPFLFGSLLFLLPLSHSSIKSRFFLTRFSLRLFLYIHRNFVFWFPLISPEQVWHIPSGPSPFRNTPVRFHPIFSLTQLEKWVICLELVGLFR